MAFTSWRGVADGVAWARHGGVGVAAAGVGVGVGGVAWHRRRMASSGAHGAAWRRISVAAAQKPEQELV